MTWGQIRMELRQELPQVDLPVLTAWIRSAYEQILKARPWSGLSAEATLITAARVNAGTVAVEQLSDTVTGTDTAWTEDMVGRMFRVEPEGDWYEIAGVDAVGQTLTLSSAYRGEDHAAAGYSITQYRYTLPNYVKSVKSMQLPNDGSAWPAFVTEDYRRWHIGDPIYWRPGPRTTLATVDLYPVPELEVAIPFTYVAAVTGFDGSNTEDEPLPWVDVETLKAAVRHRAGVSGAIEERNAGLAMMSAEDNARTPSVPLRASRWGVSRYRRFAR